LGGYDPVGEKLDLGARVVGRERGANGRWNFEMAHQGLSTVVPRPDRDTVAVEDRPDIMRVDPLQGERQDAHLSRRGAVEGESLDPG
jgi:hypothetical protein